MKALLKYQEEYSENDKVEQTKDELRALGYDDLDNLENSEDEQSSAGGGDDDVHIGDDICLDDLTGKSTSKFINSLLVKFMFKKVFILCSVVKCLN